MMEENIYSSDRIEKDIIDDIIMCRLKPGTRIVDDELCERFEVSKSTVRDALQMVKYKKYLDFNYGFGYTVSNISADETRKLYRLAYIVSDECFKFIVPHAMTFAFVEESSKYDDIPSIDADRRFHVSLVALSQKNEFLRIITTAYDRIEWWRRLNGRDEIDEDILFEHKRLKGLFYDWNGYSKEFSTALEEHYNHHILDVE